MYLGGCEKWSPNLVFKSRYRITCNSSDNCTDIGNIKIQTNRLNLHNRLGGGRVRDFPHPFGRKKINKKIKRHVKVNTHFVDRHISNAYTVWRDGDRWLYYHNNMGSDIIFFPRKGSFYDVKKKKKKNSGKKRIDSEPFGEKKWKIVFISIDPTTFLKKIYFFIFYPGYE